MQANMNTEAEKITIIEGPTPQFEPPHEAWPQSVSEGPIMRKVAMTRLRTFNGPALVQRCWRAWDKGEPIHLEYRDGEGLTQVAKIVAARWSEVAEGQVLFLYVRLN
jgi:hypothetical protein